jgi:3-deoxy-D-manno-octulosonic-acid transferase
LPPGLRVLLGVYSLVLEVVVWIALAPATWVRSRVTRGDPAELQQRLARAHRVGPQPASTPRPVIVHAVSVGEMNAAAPLVRELSGRGHRVLLTTGNAAGLLTARRLAREQSAGDDCVYLPWDRRAIRGWLTDIAPAAVVVVETEIWPNLFTACRELQIPLFIANGRVRPRDVWRYRLARPFFRDVLSAARWIGVQSARERDAFVAIGAPSARVEVAGNLKFDAALWATAEPSLLADDVGDRRLIVAGSTHDPEERWLLECALALGREGRPVRLVLAPRDVARAAAVSRMASALGLRPILWSEQSAHAAAPWDVLVLDHFGTLRACYAAADVVVIGGTFVPVGGHNLLEAAAAARPILVGPHVDGIAALLAPFEAADAIMRLTSTAPSRALTDACRILFDDPDRARQMGAHARRVCGDGAGSAERHARVIAECLATPR